MSLRTRLVALSLTVPLLAGCTAGADEEPPVPAATTDADAAGDAPAPGDEVDIDAFYDQAQQAAREAGTYFMSMTLDGGGEAITMNGQGDLSDPARPLADMTMTTPGGGAQTRIVLDGDAAYVQAPGMSGEASFIRMPVEAFVQPDGQNLTSLMNPAESMELTRAAVERIVYQGVEEEAGQRLHHYSVTMDPQRLEQTYTTQQPGVVTMPATIPYEVWLDDEHRLRKMTMEAQGSTMTMTADRYGQPVEITPPSPDQVTELPGGSGPAVPGETPAPAPTATQ